MYNKKEIQVKPDTKKIDNPYKKDRSGKSKICKKKKGGDIIDDPNGQWAHPGEITRIPSGDITMVGVDYPVFGVDDQGNKMLMLPNKNYKFPGKSVTEYPMKQSGGPITQRDTLYDPKLLNMFPLKNGNKPKYLIQDKTTTYTQKEKQKGVLDYVDDVLSAPQRAAVYALTGKYENPSKALGIDEEKHPWLATGADLLLDPMNLLGFDAIAKGAGKLVGKIAGTTTEHLDDLAKLADKAPINMHDFGKSADYVKDANFDKVKDLYKNVDNYKKYYKDILKSPEIKDILKSPEIKNIITSTIPVEQKVSKLSKVGLSTAIINDLIRQSGQYQAKDSYKITPVYDNSKPNNKLVGTMKIEKFVKPIEKKAKVSTPPSKKATAFEGNDTPPWKEKGAISFEPNTTNVSGGKGQYVYYDNNGYPKVITKDEYDRRDKLGYPKFQSGGNTPKMQAYNDSLAVYNAVQFLNTEMPKAHSESEVSAIYANPIVQKAYKVSDRSGIEPKTTGRKIPINTVNGATSYDELELKKPTYPKKKYADNTPVAFQSGGVPTENEFFNYGKPTADVPYLFVFGGAPTYNQFIDYGSDSKTNLPMLFNTGGSSMNAPIGHDAQSTKPCYNCGGKTYVSGGIFNYGSFPATMAEGGSSEPGEIKPDDVISKRKDTLMKFIRTNTMKAIKKEVNTEFAQYGLTTDAPPLMDINNFYNYKPIEMDPNQMSKPVTGSVSQTNYKRGIGLPNEFGVTAGITGINMISSMLEEKQRKEQEKQMQEMFLPDYFGVTKYSDRGDWSTNTEVLRPNKYTANFAGPYKKGGEMYLSENEINDIIQNGGEIEYLD